jgi:hypothetical protein
MPLTQGIGVISTITFTGTSLEDNFKRGVRDGNSPHAPVHYANPQENQGYVDRALGDAVGVLNNDGKVGVIVTVGGVASAIAAKNNATKPFLSVFGATPDFDGTVTGWFWGGINLDTIQHNPERLDHLCRKLHITPQQVCLLSNPDHVIWRRAEVAAWTGGRIIDARDPSTFANAFSNFNQDGNLQAMIVSGAPSFQAHKDELITEANQSNKHVCYPFQIYANQGQGRSAPKVGHHTLHGPKLATAYYELGKKVGKVLASSTHSNVDTAPMDGPHPP